MGGFGLPHPHAPANAGAGTGQPPQTNIDARKGKR